MAVFFGSLGIEYISEDVLNKIKYKSMIRTIFRIQSDDSIICGIFCIDFIEYMITGEPLLDHTNLLPSNHYLSKE